jgi:PAS domain S-box-containing protein
VGGKVAPTDAGGRSDAVRREQQHLSYGAEIHQLEVELQNRELREARGELEEAWARYAEIYEHAPTGHLSLDAFGAIRQLNLTCAALLGREKRLLEGIPLRVILDPQSRDAFDSHLRVSASSRESRTVQLQVLLPNGESRPIELLTAPRSEPARSTEPNLYHSALIDISERRRAEERREELFRREREARLLAESANQVKEDFLALVAHELRTPLAPMLLWLKALEIEGADAGVRERARLALEAGLNAHIAMIEDLVDVARGRHGELRVERHPVDLRPLVSEVVEAFAPSAVEKDVRLELSLPDEPACVSGDAGRVRQIVTNLLSNAFKFTAASGRVVVALRPVDDEVVLIVSDDGEGLHADLLEGAFDPFRQRDKVAARRQGGLGLGLTIVRQLVAAHDGIVKAESRGAGQGSSFTVKLPRIEAPASVGGPAAAVPPAPSRVSMALANARLLVVEDQPETRDALKVILEISGAEVMAVDSAEKAWEISFGDRRPDVVISDIGLPGDDGCAFMRRLREQEDQRGERRVAAVALTANTSPRDRARALLSGFDRHVGKPISFEALIATISSLLARRNR